MIYYKWKFTFIISYLQHIPWKRNVDLQKLNDLEVQALSPSLKCMEYYEQTRYLLLNSGQY